MPVSGTSQFGVVVRPSFTTNLGPLPNNLQSLLQTFSTGTAAGSYDQLYVSQVSRAATTSGDSLDLIGGGLLQPDGATAFAPVDLAGVIVINKSATATLTVGGGSNPVLNIGMTIKPNGIGLLLTSAKPGYPVTAGTGDILKVVSSEASSPYDIVIPGRSA